MTQQEYAQAVEAIDAKYRDDRAALERVWFLLNGTRAPDGIIEAAAGDRVTLRNAEELGIPSASQIDQRTEAKVPRQSYKGLSAEEKKAKKAAYMKEYLARRRAAVK